jgi:hypothetical protein
MAAGFRVGLGACVKQRFYHAALALLCGPVQRRKLSDVDRVGVTSVLKQPPLHLMLA